MKKIILLSALVALSANSIESTKHSLSVDKPHSYNIVSDITRHGVGTSERIELRAGECVNRPQQHHGLDCDTDRGRVERYVETQHPFEKIDSKVWYAWSLYIPEDQVNSMKEHTINTFYGQVKMLGWDMPLWSIILNKKGFQFTAGIGGDTCHLFDWEDARGKWTDFLFKIDYDTKYRNPSAGIGRMFNRKTDKGFLEAWINGKKSRCIVFEPLFNNKEIQYVGADKDPNKININFRYGIYEGGGLSYKGKRQHKIVYYDDVKIGSW